MATMIAVYDSNGCIGRCDAKCHEAEQPECDCICGGVNHGVGQKQAEINTRSMVEEKLRENLPRDLRGQETTVKILQDRTGELFK